MKYDYYKHTMGMSIGVFIGVIGESIGYGKYLLIPALFVYFYLKYGKVRFD